MVDCTIMVYTRSTVPSEVLQLIWTLFSVYAIDSFFGGFFSLKCLLVFSLSIVRDISEQTAKHVALTHIQHCLPVIQ